MVGTVVVGSGNPPADEPQPSPEQARVPEGIPDRTSALSLGSNWEYLAEVDLDPGDFRLFCGLINHPERGMSRQITVESPSA